MNTKTHISFFINKHFLVLIICFFYVSLLKAQFQFTNSRSGNLRSDPPLHFRQNTFCKGQCIQFIDSAYAIIPGDTIIERIWHFPGASISSFRSVELQNPPLICYDSVGKFSYSYDTFIKSASYFIACGKGYDTINIIDSSYYIAAEQNINIHFPDYVTLKACTTGENYSWQPAEKGTCATCTDYTVQPFSNTTYTCTITNKNGCDKKCIYNVTVEDAPETFYIPKAFTPNGDGLNDLFIPVVLNKKIVSLSIYNRWGEKINETFGDGAAWNGIYKNTMAVEDIYTYSIIYTGISDNFQKQLNGIIALIR